MPKSISARMFVALIALMGILVLVDAAVKAKSVPSVRFVVFLMAACLAARLKIKLPGLTGTMSVNLPFILVAAATMNSAEALAVGFISTFVQCIPKGRKLNLVQAAFNCGTIVLAVTAARYLFASASMVSAINSPALRLGVAAAGYALVNIVPVAIVIGLTEGAGILRTWRELLQLSFPYLVASAGIAGVALTVGQEIGWQVPLAVLPIMVGIFYSYRRYFAATADSEAANIPAESSSHVAAGAKA